MRLCRYCSLCAVACIKRCTRRSLLCRYAPSQFLDGHVLASIHPPRTLFFVVAASRFNPSVAFSQKKKTPRPSPTRYIHFTILCMLRLLPSLRNDRGGGGNGDGDGGEWDQRLSAKKKSRGTRTLRCCCCCCWKRKKRRRSCSHVRASASLFTCTHTYSSNERKTHTHAHAWRSL